MIDTCDPKIAGWSEDGETFVVKDPTVFEQSIIPQFFKHSKFSSFVRVRSQSIRWPLLVIFGSFSQFLTSSFHLASYSSFVSMLQQLNFYSFRKVKYHDSLRIDPEVEKETANYWKFKHEFFQRGKPHLLTSIKRMQGPSKDGTTAAVGSGSQIVQPDHVVSNSKVNNDTVAEVQSLKLRIEEMTKNIHELTAMVKVVSLRQEENRDDNSGSSVGYKRKKVSVEAASAATDPTMFGDDAYAYAQDGDIRPDEMISSMDLDEIIALPVASMPSIPESVAPVRQASSSSTQVSDLEFVETLFTAFKDDQSGDYDDGLIQEADLPFQPSQHDSNRPDPELMRRLSDALMLLPKETQEMIVNRLIAAITSTDFVASVAAAASSKPPAVASSVDDKVVVEKIVDDAPQTEGEEDRAPYPLAAATLAALLKHYSSKLQRGESTSSAAAKGGAVTKSIPVIPVHA
jgi:heat shock transcription factor 2